MTYGGPDVLTDLDMTVDRGGAVALLGPSGSGKTTLLAVLAGFLPIRSGMIDIDGARVASPGRSVPPERRSVGFVFQDNALWPHLDVLENVAYPLYRVGTPRRLARIEAASLLERFEMSALTDRRPAELSGGQQQRVGIARAIARSPRVFLLDEPAAHLDGPLRDIVRREIAARRAADGASVIHATHDPAEALAVAGRVIVLREGRVVQQGIPSEVYERPADVWVARLTGTASVVAASVVWEDGATKVAIGDRSGPTHVEPPQEGAVTLMIRPEWARLGGTFSGRVASVAYRGPHTDYGLETPGGLVVVRSSGPPAIAEGSPVGWSLDRAWSFGPR